MDQSDQKLSRINLVVFFSPAKVGPLEPEPGSTVTLTQPEMGEPQNCLCSIQSRELSSKPGP